MRRVYEPRAIDCRRDHEIMNAREEHCDLARGGLRPPLSIPPAGRAPVAFAGGGSPPSRGGAA